MPPRAPARLSGIRDDKNAAHADAVREPGGKPEAECKEISGMEEGRRKKYWCVDWHKKLGINAAAWHGQAPGTGSAGLKVHKVPPALKIKTKISLMLSAFSHGVTLLHFNSPAL